MIQDMETLGVLLLVTVTREHHVPQQADQPGQGEAQERRRMHQPDGPPTAEASRRSKSSQVNVSWLATSAMMF